MSVQFVLGRAGSGKSEYIYREILSEASKAPEKNFFLFVPEQYTLTAQLKLLELSDTKALFNVEALSFTRFARRVFNELGTGTLDVLEDTGKSLLISKILKENNESLSTLKNALMNQGGVEELKSLFSEFYQYGVKSDDLLHVFEEDDVDPFFKKKCEDIILLFEAFQKEISGRFFTAEEIPKLLCDVIDSSLLVKNSEFFFDGYTGFTPVQYDVIEKMMMLSERLVFSFAYDGCAGADASSNKSASKISEDNIKETDIFYMSEQSIFSITKLCEFTGTSILPDIVMPSPAGRRFAPGSRLLFLEKNFGLSKFKPFTDFSLGETSFCKVQSDTSELSKEDEGEISDEKALCAGLSIYLLQDPRDEIEFVCSEISRLVRTGKYHYRDFAVLAAGTADYEDDAPHIFESYHIPYFMDANVSIFFNPLLEFIESALRIVRFGFRSEDVINFMRTGLTDFDGDEVDLVDDYLFSAGYKGVKAFSNEFTLLPDGFSQEELVQINVLRERLLYLRSAGDADHFVNAAHSANADYSEITQIENILLHSDSKQGNTDGNGQEAPYYTLEKFAAALSKKDLTYKSAATAIYNLLSAYDVEKKIFEKHLEFSDAGDQLHSKEYEQIFQKVIEVLDRMVRLLGDEPCTCDEFSDDIMMLLSSINVGVLPYSNDCVVFGDMERSRLSEIRVLFLVGCHDGNIPGSFGNGGLLSDSEREKLSSLDFHLAPTAREKAFIKKFYLYLALTRSSEALFLSFTKKDKTGNSVLPSYLILDILKMFPDMSIQNIQKNARDRIYSRETLVPYLAEGLREYALHAGPVEITGNASGTEMFALMNVLKYVQSENDPDVSGDLKRVKNESLLSDGSTAFTLHSFISAAFYDGSVKPVDSEILSETHRDEETLEPVVQGSISTIETYYTCPYQYFLKYELALKEKEEYGLRSLDIGNIYHHVLQHYSNIVSKKYDDITTVSDDEMKKVLSFCIEEEMKNLSGRFLFSSASEAHIIDNVKKTIFRTVKELTKQLGRGVYRPRAFEYVFKDDMPIPAGRLILNGKIDRIDTGISRSGDSIFVRVIDYKTGDKKLSEENVKSGLELQLFTYLNAAVEKAAKDEERTASASGRTPRQIIPGGLYFSHVENPILSSEDLTNSSILIGQEAYENDVLKSYKLSGMTLNDFENAHAIDNDIFLDGDTFKSSPVTGFLLNKDKTNLQNKGNVKTIEEINNLMDTVRGEETFAAGNILAGRFEKFPFIKRTDENTKTDNTGCKYCAYHDVCLFDASLNGNYYRNINNDA